MIKKFDFLKRNFKPPQMQKWQCLIHNGTLKAFLVKVSLQKRPRKTTISSTEKGFKCTVVNQALPSLHGGSQPLELEIFYLQKSLSPPTPSPKILKNKFYHGGKEDE